MDLARLQYFKTVAETVSLRKAAELLHVTPSALSKAVKALEAELGARLVAAEGRGLALTEDGKLAYKLACRLLAGYEEFRNGFEARKVADAPLRVGSFSTFTTYFLGGFLAAEQLTGTVEVRQVMPGEIEAALLGGEVDVGITYLPIPVGGLFTLLFIVERLWLGMPPPTSVMYRDQPLAE